MRPPRRAVLASLATLPVAGCQTLLPDDDMRDDETPPDADDADDAASATTDLRAEFDLHAERTVAPVAVLADATSSTVPEGWDASYTWTIHPEHDDPRERTGPRLSHGFETPGTHHVELTLVATNGEQTSEEQPTEDTADTTITVEPRPEDHRPVTGAFEPDLTRLDEAMLSHLADIDATAGALAVAEEGTILLERGYGWIDSEHSEPLPPDAVFRIGSISKGITAALVQQLIDENALARDDPLLAHLPVDPPAGELADERLAEVTVGQALAHEGGWNRFETDDHLWDAFAIADALELEEPPTLADAIAFLLDQPLQFDPGTDTSYSNDGYVMLGGVASGALGTPYQGAVETHLLEPLGLTADVDVARADPDHRHPDEVWYDPRDRFGESQECPNALTLDEDESVPCPDGGRLFAPVRPAAGHAARTRGIARLAATIPLDVGPGETEQERNGTPLETLFGGVAGAFAMAGRHPSGLTVGAAVNRRADDELLIEDRVFEALEDLVATDALVGRSPQDGRGSE